MCGGGCGDPGGWIVRRRRRS
ncbi:MAG: hypothetical protein DLM56_09890 [Pseudonocardiales bacterium]|nr:MAG: hypothetical protein DLM56_09890 [Pseudonocardiales bacterium]